MRLKHFSFAATCIAAATSLTAHAAEIKSSALSLNSAAFQAGADIPRKYTCDGEDVSPPLRWANAPAGTKSLALIADDPDAPGGIWVHWVIYDLPPNLTALSENAAKTETLANGAKQGMNDFRKIGYGGPCPPPGPAHRYFFKLYALDAFTNLKPKATKQQMLDAIKGHVLSTAELIGRYR